MEHYLVRHRILYKDYADYVKDVSKRVQQAALAPFREQDLPVIHLQSPHIDKDAMAREVARRRGIQQRRTILVTVLTAARTSLQQLNQLADKAA